MNCDFIKTRLCPNWDRYSTPRNANELRDFIASRNVKSIIEVGSCEGWSAMWMAKYLPDNGSIVCVDHFGGSIGETGYPEDLYYRFLSNIKRAGTEINKKIIPLRTSSLEAASMFETIVDMIYLDASHDEASVYQDLVLWHPFCKPGGIMCGDDTIHPIHGDAVLKACERFAAEQNLDLHTTKDFWWYEKPYFVDEGK
jgi:predicted O-methyltransferase YrrM